MGRRIFASGVLILGLVVLLTAVTALFTGHISTASRRTGTHMVSLRSSPAAFLIALGIRTALGSMFVAGAVATFRMPDEGKGAKAKEKGREQAADQA